MEDQTLFHKMYLEISLNKNDGNTVTAMACERVAIQAQIDENKSILEMAKRHMDERAVFVLNERINELENQIL
jgi:hypothetical protein